MQQHTRNPSVPTSLGSTSTISLSTDVVMKQSGLEPCAASQKLVLYSQDSSVLCLRHDTLELERRFERHSDHIVSIQIDNTNADKPRVVSVDAGKTAIVWDLDTGDEVSRFTSYEDIRVAAWMRNGNLAFGDTMGNVILFDPIRVESISARTIFDPLTAIAPGADCRSFALGYNNGSILVAALSPSFTILHTLTTTSLSPSPITSLAWHASSSKQKSDMLAVQTYDGDLRVWSVPKSLEAEDSARVVRVLKRPDSNRRGNNWLGWSRNGRIVQYSAGVSTVWDVRTKTVAWEEIPTLDNVAGLCVYGPKGHLFTFGKDNTVQQFSLYPPVLSANVLQRPTLPPPSPPVSIEEKKEEELSFSHSDSLHTDTEDNIGNGGRDEDSMYTMTPMGRIAHEFDKLDQMEQHGGLGISHVPKPRTGSVSSQGSSGSRHSAGSHKQKQSSSSKGAVGSNNDPEYSSATTVSPGAERKASIGALPQPSPRKLHPLRQEIQISPEVTHAAQLASPVAEVHEVFANIKDRIIAITYESPRIGGPQVGMSEDDLRKEMLFCLFGWKGDIDDLIADELDSVNTRSLNAFVIRMWLGDIDQNSLSVLLGADFTVSGDWLYLALSAMGGQKSWAHVARAFVNRMLQKNEVHMAVLCLLAIGDANDAVEIYVSHKMFLEAVLLTCLNWRRDWTRISQLVRKWGEFALEQHDGMLAARCFACAGSVASAPTPPPMIQQAPMVQHPVPVSQPMAVRSPSMARTPSHLRSRSETESMNNFARGLSISAPSNPRATLKMTPKTAPLKVITSFPSPSLGVKEPIRRSATTSPHITGVNRFFHHNGPRSACATPIAMSALTPVDPFWQHDPFPFPNSAVSARTLTPGTAKPPQLPPVTEQSPASAHARTPTADKIQRMPIPAAGPIKISSPIEARTSSGFAESTAPSTLADAYRGPAPHAPPARKPSPPQRNGPTPVGVYPNTNPNSPASFRSATPRTAATIQWPSIDGIFREGSPSIGNDNKSHSRKPSISRLSPAVPSGWFAPRKDSKDKDKDKDKAPGAGDLDNFLDLVEKGQKRLDSQRATHRGTLNARSESDERRGRANRPRDLSLERGRPRANSDRKTSHMRSPSSPLPDMQETSGMYQVVPQTRMDPEPLTGRFYGDERGRSDRRTPGSSHFRSPSSPAMFTDERIHYRFDENDRIRDDDNDESYYTTARPRDQSRGRHFGASSHERSPSSPLPLSPQAMMYKQMSEEVDRQQEIEERRPRRTTRATSRGPRGPAAGSSRHVRRSRSETTMRQWSSNLERVGSMTPLTREMSTRGLPSNPRAWRSELQAASRSNSPMPGRDRSPSMAPAPPAPWDSPNHSPNRRADGHRSRSSSRKRRPSASESPRPPVPNPYYPSPVVAEYESIGSPLNTKLPELPLVPSVMGLQRSNSQHRRNQSAPVAPLVMNPLIRKLPPQPPPDSPPPLPMDLPVHPALQMHLEPSLPGKKGNQRTIRRVKRSDELNDSDEAQSIVVGIEPEHYYSPSPVMSQRSRMSPHPQHSRSPSIGVGNQF